MYVIYTAYGAAITSQDGGQVFLFTPHPLEDAHEVDILQKIIE